MILYSKKDFLELLLRTFLAMGVFEDILFSYLKEFVPAKIVAKHSPASVIPKEKTQFLKKKQERILQNH